MGTEHSPRRTSPMPAASPASLSRVTRSAAHTPIKSSTNGVATITLEASARIGTPVDPASQSPQACAANGPPSASRGITNLGQPMTKAAHREKATATAAGGDSVEEKLPNISRMALQHITHAAATTTTAPRLPSRESTDSGHRHRGRSTHHHAHGVIHGHHTRGLLTSACPSSTRSPARKKTSSPPDQHVPAPLHHADPRACNNGSKSHSPARRRSQYGRHSGTSHGTTRVQSTSTPTRSASQHRRGHLYRGHPQPLHASDPGSTRSGSAPALGKKMRSRSTRTDIKLPTLRAERLGRSASIEEDVTPHDRFLERKQVLQHTRQAKQSLTHAGHRVPQRYMMVGYRASLANRQQMSEEELLHLQRLAIAPAPDLYFGKGINSSVPQLHRRHLARAQLRGRLASKEMQIHGVAMDTPGQCEDEGEEAALVEEDEGEEDEEDIEEVLKEVVEEDDEEDDEGKDGKADDDDEREEGEDAPQSVYDDPLAEADEEGDNDDNVSTVTSLHTEMSQLLMAKEDADQGTGMRFGRISTGWEGTDLDPAQAQLETPELLREAAEEIEEEVEAEDEDGEGEDEGAKREEGGNGEEQKGQEQKGQEQGGGGEQGELEVHNKEEEDCEETGVKKKEESEAQSEAQSVAQDGADVDTEGKKEPGQQSPQPSAGQAAKGEEDSTENDDNNGDSQLSSTTADDAEGEQAQ